MTTNIALASWRHWIPLALISVLMAATFGAQADDGHNHGAETPATQGSASPRVEAHSDLFELVGIVDKGQMTVYLDRFATNEPVIGAKLEFESGTTKGVATPQPDGTYLVKFDALSKPGQVPLSFTVTAGSDTDLLAGDLDLKDPHDHHDEAAGKPWLRWLGFAAAALAALALAAFALRMRAARRARKEFQ